MNDSHFFSSDYPYKLYVNPSVGVCVNLYRFPRERERNGIRKTYLYNFDPLKPRFYIVKRGFTGYTLFFLFRLKNIDLCFEQEYEKYQNFLSENFHFWW